MSKDIFDSEQMMYTDYPFTELGDEPYVHAPIRQVKFLSYDGNKYATVELPNGVTTDVKMGYLFASRDELLVKMGLK